MIKLLFIQSWYSISDEELEFQIYDRLSFQQFLDFPKKIPDYPTIWRFREKFTQSDAADKIFDELQRQIEARNIKIKEGTIQDARFIEADPGKKRGSIEDFVRGLKKNNYEKFYLKNGTYFLHTQEIFIREVGRVRLLISYKAEDEKNKKYYITDHLDWENVKYMKVLLKRWNIESFHRDAKKI